MLISNNIKEGISIKHFLPADIALVQNFYKQTSYKSADSTLPQDEIIAAYQADEVIGLYRLCHEGDVCVLRGFYVLEAYRGNGIGTAMLQALHKIAYGKDVYLICMNNRNSFYAKAGFRLAGNDVSEMLLQRKNKYNNPGMNILLRLTKNVY